MVQLGGGTLWGLLSLLTDAQSFDGMHRYSFVLFTQIKALTFCFSCLEMLEMSQHGDNRNVDLLVGDIYGSDYSKLGLKSSKIASSFGKVFKKGERKNERSFKSEDLSRSLLYMIRYAIKSCFCCCKCLYVCTQRDTPQQQHWTDCLFECATARLEKNLFWRRFHSR